MMDSAWHILEFPVPLCLIRNGPVVLYTDSKVPWLLAGGEQHSTLLASICILGNIARHK